MLWEHRKERLDDLLSGAYQGTSRQDWLYIGDRAGQQITISSVLGFVYAIYCECGEVYIEETGGNLKTRITEHQRSVRNWDKNDAIACHVSYRN